MAQIEGRNPPPPGSSPGSKTAGGQGSPEGARPRSREALEGEPDRDALSRRKAPTDPGELGTDDVGAAREGSRGLSLGKDRPPSDLVTPWAESSTGSTSASSSSSEESVPGSPSEACTTSRSSRGEVSAEDALEGRGLLREVL